MHVLLHYITYFHKFAIIYPVSWLNHKQTLREQGVEEFETLILRRKYFYSDQNVESRDPIQLNLLYVQVSMNNYEYKYKYRVPPPQETQRNTETYYFTKNQWKTPNKIKTESLKMLFL